MPTMRLIVSGVAVSFALAAIGCGKSDKPKTAPVSGTVTMEGKPLEGAVVTFYGVTGRLSPASGTTNAQGYYELGFAGNKGAEPGMYNVVIAHYTNADGTPIKADKESGMDVEQLIQQGKAIQDLPATYSDLPQTVLQNYEVKLGQSHKFDFKLNAGGTAPPK